MANIKRLQWPLCTKSWSPKSIYEQDRVNIKYQRRTGRTGLTITINLIDSLYYTALTCNGLQLDRDHYDYINKYHGASQEPSSDRVEHRVRASQCNDTGGLFLVHVLAKKGIPYVINDNNMSTIVAQKWGNFITIGIPVISMLRKQRLEQLMNNVLLENRAKIGHAYKHVVTCSI